MPHKKAPRIVVLVVVVLLAGGGVWYWRTHRPCPADGRLVLYGNVDIRQVDLAFHGTDRVASMAVEEGDPVARGQLLAELDTRRLRAAVALARAQVEAQKQVLAALRAGSRPEEIRRAAAEVEAAEATLHDARARRELVEKGYARGAATSQELTDAGSAAESAAATLKALQAALALAIAGPREEDIAAAEATVRARQAELSLREHELADAYLYAPADGVIQDRILQPGDMASPQRPAFTLALTSPVWVRAYVSETDLGRVRPGMKAYVTTDSFPGKRYEGWIGFVSPTAEFTPKSVETPELRTQLVYEVRVLVRNPQDELRLGMPATVTIDLTQPPTTMPASAPAPAPATRPTSAPARPEPRGR